MNCHIPGCLGDYDFEHIALFAKRRFVDGCNTVALLQQARSEREREEIALVSLLDVDNEAVRELHLSCKYNGQCRIMDCRERLRAMIEHELQIQGHADSTH